MGSVKQLYCGRVTQEVRVGGEVCVFYVRAFSLRQAKLLIAHMYNRSRGRIPHAFVEMDVAEATPASMNAKPR